MYEHKYELDVAGELAIAISPTCHCGAVRLELDVESQKVTGHYLALKVDGLKDALCP